MYAHMMGNHDLNRTQQVDEAGRSVGEIQDWIVRQLSEELQIGREKIKLDQPILSCGIDSVQVVSLMSNLEDWGGFRFPENPLDELTTIEQLSHSVAGLTRSARLDDRV